MQQFQIFEIAALFILCRDDNAFLLFLIACSSICIIPKYEVEEDVEAVVELEEEVVDNIWLLSFSTFFSCTLLSGIEEALR